MQVGTYPTRNFAHTILIFRSGMDFLFIQFAHMRYTNAQSTLDTQRKVSEDPKDFAFLRIIQSRFSHISQRFWFPADCPISCIFTVYKYQKLIQCTLSLCIAYIPKILVSLSNLLHITVYKYQGFRIYVCIVQLCLLYTSIKSSKEFPAYSWVALFSYEKRRQYLP